MSDQMKEKMGGSCATYGWEKKCTQGFAGETCRTKATWKTEAYTGEQY